MLAVAALVMGFVIQEASRRSTIEFFSEPIVLGPGVSAVAVDVDPLQVPTDGTVAVRLYVSGSRPIPAVRILINPSGLEVPPESAPRLDRVNPGASDLRSIWVHVPVPGYLRNRPGVYLLRIAGHAPTIGLVRLLASTK